MREFLRRHVSGWLLFVAAGAAITGTAHADSLTEAVERSLATFPELRSSAANRRAVNETISQARALRLPTLDAQLGQGRQRTDSPITRAIGAQTLGRSEAELNVSQLLFDGGATSSQIRRQEALSESASLQYNSAAEQVALRASQAYLEVLRLRQLVDIAQSNVAANQRTLDQVNLIVESGRGRRADSRQSEARLALAQSSLTTLRGQLDQAESEYRHMTGTLPGPLLPPPSPDAAVPASLRQSIDEALEKNPAVLSAKQELEAAIADMDFARTRMNPRVTMELDATHDRDIGGLRGLNSDMTAIVRLRQNLFRGGADSSRAREAEARRDEAQGKLATQRNEVERDVRQAWDNLASERSRLPQLRLHSAAAADVVEAYRAQFRIGQRSLIDVLNAENEYFSARSDETTGTYTVNAAMYRLLASVGRLLSGLGVAVPDAMQPEATVRSEPQ